MTPNSAVAAPVAEPCAAERTQAARIGEVLFRNRGWIPVPFLAVPLLVPGVQAPETWIVGLLMVAVGEFIRLAGVAAAGTVTRRRSRNVQRLVDYGAFAWCRNPLYVGNWLVWLGFTVVSGVLWFLPVAALIFAIEYHYIVRYEEGVLESIFGAEYLAYKERTPRWFARPPSSPSSGPHAWGEAIWSERSTVLQYVALVAAFLVKDRYFT
jgi:protein-S-isoprenylcysteine O-methyltransferase Ste14